MSALDRQAEDALKHVLDPEAGINIVDLGLVYAIEAEQKRVAVTMTFTTEACPVGPALLAEAEHVLAALPGAPAVDIAVTFDPPWTPARITPDGRRALQN